MTEREITHVVSQGTSWSLSDAHSRFDRTPSSWLLLFVCAAALLVSFRHTMFLMADTWAHSRTYSHCFLILPLFVYLVWRRRERVVGLAPAANYWGVPWLAALAFIWVLGNLGEAKIVQEWAVVSMLIAVAWTLLGTIIVRALAFPLLFLFFAVPFGTSLIRPLQDFTAWFVIHALTISQIPAVMEKHVISLPNGVWTVAEACSGIRFLLTSLVVGTVFSFLMYRSPRRRVVFMCASIVLPVIGNGLRAYGIIALAYLTNNRLAAGVDHVVYGGVFVVLVQLVLMMVGLRWHQHPEPVARMAPGSTGVKTASQNGPSSSLNRGLWVGAASLLIIVLAPLAAARLWAGTPDLSPWADPPVHVIAPWQVATSGDLNWEPEERDPEKTFNQSYQYATNRVELSWAQYSGRRAMDFGTHPDGTENPQSILTDDGFERARINGRYIQVSRTRVESARDSRRIWTWYYVDGEYTASRGRVRFLQAKARLFGEPASVTVIRLETDNRTNAADRERALQDFLLHTSFLTGAGPSTVSLSTLIIDGFDAH